MEDRQTSQPQRVVCRSPVWTKDWLVRIERAVNVSAAGFGAVAFSSFRSSRGEAFRRSFRSCGLNQKVEAATDWTVREVGP
jgi:hypothetical protein